MSHLRIRAKANLLRQNKTSFKSFTDIHNNANPSTFLFQGGSETWSMVVGGERHRKKGIPPTPAALPTMTNERYCPRMGPDSLPAGGRGWEEGAAKRGYTINVIVPVWAPKRDPRWKRDK